MHDHWTYYVPYTGGKNIFHEDLLNLQCRIWYGILCMNEVRHACNIIILVVYKYDGAF